MNKARKPYLAPRQPAARAIATSRRLPLSQTGIGPILPLLWFGTALLAGLLPGLR